jgi:hypothetical protein
VRSTVAISSLQVAKKIEESVLSKDDYQEGGIKSGK